METVDGRVRDCARFAEKFDDELKFFKGWIDKPKAVGSIVPTSSVTARRMASVVDTQVGPAGARSRTRHRRHHQGDPCARRETREPLRGRIFARFRRHLRRHYPGVNVIEGDAFDLDETLGDKRDTMFDCVVSGVPLLNFPVAAPRRLSRRPARPHSARPAGRAAHLRTEIAGAARPRRLHGRAFPLHPAQHSADAALDLPPRAAKLTVAARQPNRTIAY